MPPAGSYEETLGTDTGFVSVFDVNGNFVARAVTGGDLNAPWGVAIAPAGFGIYGGDLLIGNFGDGLITAYDPTTYAYLGTVADGTGKAIAYPGLWEIFVPTATATIPNSIYFTAGLANETHGLFGVISNGATTTATPTFNLSADSQVDLCRGGDVLCADDQRCAQQRLYRHGVTDLQRRSRWGGVQLFSFTTPGHGQCACDLYLHNSNLKRQHALWRVDVQWPRPTPGHGHRLRPAAALRSGAHHAPPETVRRIESTGSRRSLVHLCRPCGGMLVHTARACHAGRHVKHYDHRDVGKHKAERRRRLDRPLGCTLYLSGSPPLIRGGVFLRHSLRSRTPGERATRLMASDFGGEDADIFDAAVVLGVVHAVADDEPVGDLEGHVVGFDGDEAALGFVEAGGDLE